MAPPLAELVVVRERFGHERIEVRPGKIERIHPIPMAPARVAARRQFRVRLGIERAKDVCAVLAAASALEYEGTLTSGTTAGPEHTVPRARRVAVSVSPGGADRMSFVKRT